MANFLLAYDNQTDVCTVVASSANAAFPVANLKDYRLVKKWRSASAASANTVLNVLTPATFYMGAVGLIATNCSTAAQYRVRLYSDTAQAVQVYDSGTVDLFPSGSLPESEIPAGSANSGTARPTLAEVRRFQCNVIHIPPTPVQARGIKLEIFDTANADGYVEAGRLFIGRVFRPKNNPEYGGAALRLTSRTELTEATDGTPYFTTRQPKFSIPFSLRWLTRDEAMRVLDIQALADVYGEVLVMWDSADVAYWWRRHAFGRLKQLDPIDHPLFATYATAFQVEGTLA